MDNGLKTVRFESNLAEGDSIHGMIITKMTEKSCWLDNKRHSWATIQQMIANEGKVQTKMNSNKFVDWTNKEEVLKYYNSFRMWGFYVSNGDVKKDNLQLLEVKDGVIFWNNEYWLPAPGGTHDSPNQKTDVEDGWCYVHIFKRFNTWFGNQTKYQSNIFHVRNRVNINPTLEDVSKLKPNSTEIYCYPYSGPNEHFRVEYTQSGRSGLSIDNVSFTNFKEFFKKTYCSDRWGYNTDFIIIPDEIMKKIMYGENPFTNSLEGQLSQILNTASYDIDDSESYGEYSLNYIKICERDSKTFFDHIEKRLRQLTRFTNSTKTGDS